MDNVQYTLVVTSCGRHDLLKKTLQSFATFADITPVETIIIEDGPNTPDVLNFSGLGNIKVITNETRKGQIYSVDRAYAEVKTEYVFHCEDDWEFTKTGFIKESLDILESNQNIMMVNLRTDWQHPIIAGEKFDTIKPDWDGGWGAFSFNPGLRRMSDYYKIGSYGKHVGYNPYEVGELYLSKLYRTLGFSIASLQTNPFVQHIGWGDRHVDWATAPKPPKVLIAIPMCWKYEYKDQDDNNIHKSRISNARIDAQRATWLKDLEAFKSYVDFKYFYGRCEHDPLYKTAWPRKPEKDEKFLNVPDDYKGLTHKMKAIFQYALDNGYDYLFKTDDDTFVYVDRLLASGYEKFDYTGYCTNNPAHPQDKLYASGGSGYWLSRKAMEILVKATPDDWAEDRWVGNVLYRNGIKVVRDARYLPGFREHYVKLENLPKNHSYITLHAVAPENMAEVYNQVVNPNFTLINKAIGDDYDGDDPRCEFDKIMAEVMVDMADMNKDLKNKVNQSIERLVKLVVAERRRVDILESRLEKYNQKASHKI